MADKQTDKDYPFSLEEFHAIYGKVPRLTVEVIIKSNKGVLLSLRDIEPCKGLWHFPGGTVFFGEPLAEAVKRVARRELGVEVTGTTFIDYLEYPSHYKNGMDSPVGMAFLADYEGELAPNPEASRLEWFTAVPPDMHPDQDTFLKKLLES